jgi:hypothetical protein
MNEGVTENTNFRRHASLSNKHFSKGMCITYKKNEFFMKGRIALEDVVEQLTSEAVYSDIILIFTFVIPLC